MEGSRPIDAPLWSAVDRVIDTAPDPSGIVAQGIGPIAAWRWRARGIPVPSDIENVARRSAFSSLCAPALLRDVRALLDGPIILLKGPESANLYPDPLIRPFGDIDLLVEDVATAERRLLDAGFTFGGDVSRKIAGHHHDTPLRKPGLPVAIELHHEPGWLSWMSPPANARLFATAVPSSTGVPGIQALPPAEFALFLAAHSWRHGPYHSLRHLIDIALARHHAPAPDLLDLAAQWGMQNVWRATNAMIDAVFDDDPTSLSRRQRQWIRHILCMRERTVAEFYLAQWSRGLAAPTATTAARTVLSDIRFSFAVHDWQDRRMKAQRISAALRQATRPRSRLCR